MSRSNVAAQSLEDAAQTIADSDQALSDADRTRSDADQSSSQRDRGEADADRRASQRDLTAADRDRSLYAITDAKFQDAGAKFQDVLAAVEAERAPRASEREAAAADRARAGEDRARAAADRSRAALDREQAKIALEKAELDDLTGFYRLGLGTAVLQREIDRSRRSGGRLALAYCDVDGLKQVNDEQGHFAGDALLRAVAAAIRSRLRSYDPVVRVGGDEFVCALSQTDLEQAGRIFNDIQAEFAKGRTGRSMSYGLAALRPDDSLATLVERSDIALREARSASS